MEKQKRKICYIITSFIHYSRSFLLLEELERREDIDLHIIVGGSALISKYTSKNANLLNILAAEGYQNVHTVYFTLEGDVSVVKAKTLGFGIVEFSAKYNELKPDMVVVRGDRYEVLSAVLAAVYMNIPVAHIEGGDVSGTLDESVRHSITKLAQLHFPTNDAARRRILKMGENPRFVFNVGSPDVEIARKVKTEAVEDLNQTGSGAKDIDLKRQYLMVMFHSVTTDLNTLGAETKMLLKVVHQLDLPTLWFWPNADLGSEIISGRIREFSDQTEEHKIRFMRYLPPRQFLSLLKGASCLIGNSSSGLKESSILGVPVIDVGTRQNQRLSPENVMKVRFNESEIKKSILEQIQRGKYPAQVDYYKPGTAKKIAHKIASVKLSLQKYYHEN